MSAWRRRAEEALRPRLTEGERIEVVARAARFESMRRGEGHRPAAIGGAIGFAVGGLPVLIAGAPWGTVAVVAFAFGLMGAVSGFEFANRRATVALTDRRLLVVPRGGRETEAYDADRAAPATVETGARSPILVLPNGRRWVLLSTTAEDEQAAAALRDAVGSSPAA